MAGDPERMHETEALKNGVRYVKNQMESCEKLAKDLQVDMLKPIGSN